MRTDLFVCLACGNPAPEGNGECANCVDYFARLINSDEGIMARFEADFAAEFGEKS